MCVSYEIITDGKSEKQKTKAPKKSMKKIIKKLG